MNLKELRAEVIKDNDDSINNADITGWLNRALDDLTIIAKYTKSVTVNLTNGQYTLPTDFLEVVTISANIPRLPLSDFESEGYKLIGNILSLQNSKVTSFQMIYYATLPRLVGDTDIPAIPENFHDLLVLYALMKAKYVDELDDLYRISSREYNAKKEEFARYIGRLQAVPTPMKNKYGAYYG